MHKIIREALTISGLMIGFSAVATASPATPLFKGEAAQTAQAQQVSYYYNHHRYNHRSWDKRHRRWHYY